MERCDFYGKALAFVSLLDALIRIPSVSALTNRPLIEFVEEVFGEAAGIFENCRITMQAG